MVPSVTTLTKIVIIVFITQEKRVLLAKEGEHGNVIYIVPPICINEEDVTEKERWSSSSSLQFAEEDVVII